MLSSEDKKLISNIYKDIPVPEKDRIDYRELKFKKVLYLQNTLLIGMDEDNPNTYYFFEFIYKTESAARFGYAAGL